MEADRYGFMYPKVKEALCIQCLQCEKICIFKQGGKENV